MSGMGINSKAWNGKQLTSVLQKETKARMDVQLGVSLCRHFVIGVTKKGIKEIARRFAKDDLAVEKMLLLNQDYTIYALQAGHTQRIKCCNLRSGRRLSRTTAARVIGGILVSIDDTASIPQPDRRHN